MGDFFKSTKFKILLLIFFLLLGFIVAAARYGILGTITNQVVDTITSPIKEVSTFLTNKFTGLFERFAYSSTYFDEVQLLREEVKRQREQLIEYDKIRKENEYLKDLLNVVDLEEQKEYVNAVIIDRDSTDPYHTFGINKGEKHGIKVGDPVITPDGLVGYVKSTTTSGAIIQTILNPETHVGALSTQTQETGIIKGDLEEALNGNIILDNININAMLKEGDTIVTAGIDESYYPSEIVIGKVLKVDKKTTGTSKMAIIKPFVDISTIKEVTVIIHFKEKDAEQSTDADDDSSGNDNE